MVARWGRTKELKGALIGFGASLGVTALGFDASVTLSTYGLYLGHYGPFFVIAGIPIFLNLVLAYALLKKEQRVIRYSMLGTGVGLSLVLGYFIFQGLFTGLIPSG